ncbi:hypothetical protein BDN70DRAFT_479796 [Pholiota conissans]|uniref:Uncharacterized protein n=1 Tax=Pholiota conissans TaxID=109636 RepID=A0A9P5YPM7_9AGAR|nr:hypothetical protein BDN70DRAFT_479796 [Pholiota conissans]
MRHASRQPTYSIRVLIDYRLSNVGFRPRHKNSSIQSHTALLNVALSNKSSRKPHSLFLLTQFRLPQRDLHIQRICIHICEQNDPNWLCQRLRLFDDLLSHRSFPHFLHDSDPRVTIHVVPRSEPISSPQGIMDILVSHPSRRFEYS